MYLICQKTPISVNWNKVDAPSINIYCILTENALQHVKLPIIALKYHATFKILFNFVKYTVQLSKYGATFRNISYNSARMYIFWKHVK